MIVPQTIKVVAESQFKEDPDVLFVRKCVGCGNVFYTRTHEDEHCTRCGCSDTVLQTREANSADKQ